LVSYTSGDYIYRVACCGLEKMSENPVMSFPIKKRINTELFIDRNAELYIQEWEPNFLEKLKKG